MNNILLEKAYPYTIIKQKSINCTEVDSLLKEYLILNTKK